MSLVGAALAYARRGWPVLPVAWPTTTGEHPRCSCGRADCRRIGKHPAGLLVPNGLIQATTDIGQIEAWWRAAPSANVGVVLGERAGAFVLDIDPSTGGDRTLIQLVRDHGPLGETLHTLTGSGGDHLWFRWPGVPVITCANRPGAGIDVRGDGGYVLAPPSLHANGTRYTWISPYAVPERAPRWLLDLLLPAPSPPQRVQPPRNTASTNIEARATAYLASLPPAVQGQNGSKALFLAALHLVKGFGLAPDLALLLLERDYNPGCQPPWSLRELKHYVRCAERSKTSAGYLLSR